MSIPFSETYLGRIRALLGSRRLLMPAARAVVTDAAGRILLHHRRDFRVWGLPGGHPEEGESIRECLIREVQEETGLTLTSLEVFGYASDPAVETTIYPNGDCLQSFALLLHSAEWKGELNRSNAESLDVRFFDRDHLPEEILPNERKTIEAFLRFVEDGRFQWC